jgi:hypothetical protein
LSFNPDLTSFNHVFSYFEVVVPDKTFTNVYEVLFNGIRVETSLDCVGVEEFEFFVKDYSGCPFSVGTGNIEFGRCERELGSHFV